MILTALLNREANLDGMYVHFLELWSSHFSEERSQNPTPRERLACLEVLHRRRARTIRRAKPRMAKEPINHHLACSFMNEIALESPGALS